MKGNGTNASNREWVESGLRFWREQASKKKSKLNLWNVRMFEAWARDLGIQL